MASEPRSNASSPSVPCYKCCGTNPSWHVERISTNRAFCNQYLAGQQKHKQDELLFLWLLSSHSAHTVGAVHLLLTVGTHLETPCGWWIPKTSLSRFLSLTHMWTNTHTHCFSVLVRIPAVTVCSETKREKKHLVNLNIGSNEESSLEWPCRNTRLCPSKAWFYAKSSLIPVIPKLLAMHPLL